MIHTWTCRVCKGEYKTACGTLTYNERGKLVDAYQVKSYRRWRSSRLCSICYTKFSESFNPVFEILFRLEEKGRELNRIIDELREIFEGV